MRKFGLTAAFAFLLLSAGGAAACAAENLIEGGGFDDSSHRWVLREGAEITDELARSGEKSLKMSGTTGQAFITVSGLEPGKFYRADAWVLTRNMPPEAEGYIQVYPQAKDRKMYQANLDNHDWEPIVCWFPAEDEKPFRIYLLREGLPGGEVFFDDISLKECQDPSLSSVTFEDGTAIGLDFYVHRGRSTIFRVVQKPTPRGGEHCLLGAPASIRYIRHRPLEEGMVEFDFTVNLNQGGRASANVHSLRIDLDTQIKNRTKVDGSVRLETLGSFFPGRWYRFRGIIDLDAQTYDLEVTDFEDPLYSFTRRNLRFQDEMDSVLRLVLSSPEEGGFWDDIYIGPVRTNN